LTSTIVVGPPQQCLLVPETEVLGQDTVEIPVAGLTGTNNDGPLGTY